METLYTSKLKSKIHYDFCHRVIPDNLLPAIMKCNSNVLTERDKEQIGQTTKHLGKIKGAEELLDYISRYENWFPCLLRALKDPEVKLEGFAKHLEKLKAELDDELVPEDDELVPEAQVFREQRDPQNDFDFGDDGGAAAGEHDNLQNRSNMSAELEPDGPMDEEHSYERVNNDGSQPSGPQRPSSHVYEDYVQPMRSPPGGAGAAPGSSAAFQTSNRVGGAQEEEPGQVHGEEYDFSREETENEFSSFPAWDSHITERSIKAILEPFLGEDGRYVFWYWTELKRPAISVTFGGVMKNFILHKKPRKSIPGEVKYYFINKQQHCNPSMTELLRFHLRTGIKNTEPDCQHQLIRLRRSP